MFGGLFHRLFWLISLFMLLVTILNFAIFLSSQAPKENESDASTWKLFTIDLILVCGFMVQHSGMLSKLYYDIIAEWGMIPISKTLYMLMSTLSLWVLMVYWQPIPEVYLWNIDIRESHTLSLFFMIAHCVLWAVFFTQVFCYKPLHLLGFYHAFGIRRPISQQLMLLLEHLPHAGSSCFITVLWLHPFMTFDRLILATVLTTYLCCSLSVSGADYSYVQKCSLKSTRTVYTATYKQQVQ